MQSKAPHFFLFLCLPCLVICLALAAPARDGRNFGGDFRILQATEHGENMEVRLSLRVINNSGFDVQNATIRLAGSPITQSSGELADWVKDQPSFKNVALHFNEHKIVPPLVGTFTIPAQVYEQWQKGVPDFVILYRDVSGERHSERIDLAPAP